MDAAIEAISSSLKDFTSQLEAVGKTFDEDKSSKVPAKQTTMFLSLHAQLTALGLQFTKLISSLKTTQGITCANGEEAKTKSRRKADHLDDLEQKSLLGKIAINIQDPEMKKRIGILESGDYSQFNYDLLVTEVNKRYGLNINSREDLQDIRRVSRAGTVVLTFFDHKPGSKYSDLVSAIKTKGNNAKGQCLYANFVLTNRRNSLLYEIRKAHKDGKVEKYYSDYDGSLVVVLKGSMVKHRITSQSTKANDYTLTTHTRDELLLLLK